MAAWTTDDSTRRTAASRKGLPLGSLASRGVIRSTLELGKFRNSPKSELWTFASPKVGNRGFANCFSLTNIPSFRFVYNADPVSHLPPSINHILEFEHVRGEIYSPQANRIIFCHESAHVRGTDARCSTSSSWKRALRSASFVDHSKALWFDKNGDDGKGGQWGDDCGKMTPLKQFILNQDDPDSKLG